MTYYNPKTNRYERSWSKEEEQQAWALYSKGKSYSQIGKRLNRTRGMVSTKIATLKKRHKAKEFDGTEIKKLWVDEVGITDTVKKMFMSDKELIEKNRDDLRKWIDVR